ncbi:putative cytochrome P450 [Camillea tinctor]|nr:putative cytochrome P450 [Camillea tinctor]
MLGYSLYSLGGVLLLLVVLYRLGYCVYLLWFHHLSKYPGPKLAAISEIWYVKTWISGEWPRKIYEAHRKYGDIVRIAPNELSFRTPQSFKDLYGPPSKTRKLFPKSERFYDMGTTNLALEMDPEEHAKQYKLFAPAFRTSALRSQEHVIQEHVDLLVSQIRRRGVSTGEALNMALWLEWLTFDIIGELTFGESFHAVKETRSHYWVTVLLGFNYGGSLVAMRHRLSILGPILRWAPVFSKAAEETTRGLEQHKKLTIEKTQKRIAMGPSHKTQDFFAHALQHGTEEEKELKKLSEQAMIFITAGAETNAHALGSTMWFLAHPDYAHCMKKLQDEVRGTFARYEDITGDRAAQLPYLQAVLDEALRMVPPAPAGPPRVSPGETVDGVYMPAGTYVSTDLWALHHDERNVERPWEFDPSRWLVAGEGEEGEAGTKRRQRPFTAPFSMGPRMCIGINLAWIEMRVALAKMVYAFDWEIEEGCPNWLTENKLYVLWKKPKLMIKLKDASGKGSSVG